MAQFCAKTHAPVKLLIRVSGSGRPRWKRITTWKRWANFFKFSGCVSQKSLNIMVCSPHKKSLDIFVVVSQKHFECERRHLIIILVHFLAFLTIRNNGFGARAVQKHPRDRICADITPIDVLAIKTEVDSHSCLELPHRDHLILCVARV